MPIRESDLFPAEYDAEDATVDTEIPSEAIELEQEDVAEIPRLLESPQDFEWREIPDEAPFSIKGVFKEPGFGTFELNLTRSLAQQLGPFFDSLAQVPLTADHVNRTRRRGCLCALYRRRLIVRRKIRCTGWPQDSLGTAPP